MFIYSKDLQRLYSSCISHKLKEMPEWDFRRQKSTTHKTLRTWPLFHRCSVIFQPYVHFLCSNDDKIFQNDNAPSYSVHVVHDRNFLDNSSSWFGHLDHQICTPWSKFRILSKGPLMPKFQFLPQRRHYGLLSKQHGWTYLLAILATSWVHTRSGCCISAN